MAFPKKRRGPKNVLALDLLRKHFRDVALSTLSVTTRTFVHRIRADLQAALGEMFDGSASVAHFSGVRTDYAFNGIDFGSLTVEGNNAPVVTPPEFEAVDIGGTEPVRCLKTGFWLLEDDGEHYAVLMSPTARTGDDVNGVRFYVASRNTPAGESLSTNFFRKIEESVSRSRSYRGKVLSLESQHWYSGRSSGIKVHRLPAVARGDLILPLNTVELLERNVIGFCRRRAELARRGQSIKKGLLFYGPPGTGKTHTIRYLAGMLADHTTLLITADQVAILPEYMTLARLLQPTIVVIEDADLIGRDRASMESACTEVVLNRLLNEMDGLKEEAQVMFILTTNRPESLEAALASRPGRIDQAIEFPLPSAENRKKLVQVYGKGMQIGTEVVQAIVDRTEGVSAAFIKELMRRATQFRLERQPDGDDIGLPDVTAALEEILFKGGSLNVKLLGGHASLAGASPA